MRNELLMEQEAKQVVRYLTDKGYSAFFVGGYVRDRMLERPIKDIDIATSALPKQVMEVFPHTAPTGLQHGTVTVIMEHCAFEVTTFRKESGYEQYRRPEKVDFIDSIFEDLSRRDFTINAMALDVNGQLFDPFDGKTDLMDRKQLRCVGDPSLRFAEDALRMMRCIRFAAEYGLHIESGTWRALIDHCTKLRHIAMERISAELDKIVCGQGSVRGIELLNASGLHEWFKRPLEMPKGALRQLVNSGHLKILPELADGDLRWAALLLLLGTSPAKSQNLLRGLVFPKQRMRRIMGIITFHHWFVGTGWSAQDWKQGAIVYGKSTLQGWMDIMGAVRSGGYLSRALDDKVPVHAVENLLEHGAVWLGDMPVETVGDLKISGNDLRQLGKERGPWIGELLNRLLLETAIGNVPNDKAILLEQARRYMEEA